MVKPNNQKVFARKVYNIFPQFDAMPHKILHVMNDDKGGIHEKFPVKNYHKMNMLSQTNELDEVRDQIQKFQKRYQ